jgi:probable F420-dependent oxidoreductase
MPESLRVGCTLPTSGAAADPAALGGLAQTAEALDFDSVWISDHVVIPERISSNYPYSVDGAFQTSAKQTYLEPLTALGYLAGITRKVRLGIAVLILPYRHPLLTAKMVATLDNLSGGRIDLGIGVGWMQEEFAALGVPAEMYTHRGGVSDEQLKILRTVWTEDVAGFEGKFYRFEPVGAHPHPIQKPNPPIWIGGHTRPALRRVALYGDGWLPIGGRPPANLPPSELADSIASIRRQAAEAGRGANALRVCFDTTIDFAATDGRPFSGSSESIAGQLRGYVEAGADSLVVSFGRQPPAQYEQCLRRFAEEVRPALSSVQVSS